MNVVTYPLGHTPSELDRLDTQAELLRDPLLEKLARDSSSCLEIGCGNGSNLSILRQINPTIKYTGIDCAAEAISSATTRFSHDENAQFLVMDGSDLKFSEESFDLVFTKLVLWSVGTGWTKILNEAFRTLSPGGNFYALEPVNDLIEFFPEKQAAKKWMKAWDDAARKNGLDTSIGNKVASELESAGYCQIDAKFFPVIATGSEQERYQAIVKNLKGFYMGPAADLLGLECSDKQRKEAIRELDSFTDESLVMDALFVSWGKKPIC